MKVICSESGLEFEAQNKRTKMFSEISALKSDAHRDGYYGPACDSLVEVRRAGGYTNIAEYMELVHASLEKKITANKAYRTMRQDEENKRKEAHKAAMVARRITNQKLRDHGYRWQKSGVIATFDDYDEGPEHSEWTLFAPDGRIVTVAEASAEIDGKGK